MAQTLVEQYSDSEHIEAAHFGADVRWMPMEAGQHALELVRVQFDKLWAGRFRERRTRVRHARQNPDRAFIKFHTFPESELIIDGTSIGAGTIICHARADEFTERTTGAVDWGILSLPFDDMINLGNVYLEGNLTTTTRTLSIIPPVEALDRLRRLHICTATLAGDAPHILSHSETARNLEQSLIEALAACLASGTSTDHRMGHHSRRSIMRKFHQVLEENLEEPVYVPEICKAIGVSERGLRYCCEQYLGMSPKQYLTLRRIHMAQRALRSASGTDQSVTEIAMRFGFWQLGRFAGMYRSIFGESPSATLRRPSNK